MTTNTNFNAPSPCGEGWGGVRSPRVNGRGGVLTWRRYSRKGYAIFNSLGREVVIGVLAVTMLCTQQVTARTLHPTIDIEHETAREDSLAEVTVTGTMTPLTEMQQARIVNVITRDEINRAPASTVNDILKAVAGVDVRQRGGFSMQTDIGIDGGTFDQVTILLNGINITNPQTGHHTLDLPVNPADIERIEVLEGAASRVYGASAFGGAINIVTRGTQSQSTQCNVTDMSLYAGSWGTVGGNASLGFDCRGTRHHLSGGAVRSDGGTENSDFHRTNAFYTGTIDLGRHTLTWQGGLAQKQYGANTFYSARYPNQWEANRRYFASMAGNIVVSEVIGLHIRPTVYWNRAHDHFQLVRGTSTGENFHRSDVLAASVTADMRWVAGKTAVGFAVRHESIRSSNLGQPYANPTLHPVPHHREAYYKCHDERSQYDINLEHNVLLDKITISAGVIASMNDATGHGWHLYPGVDVAYRATSGWKLFASYNQGFRIPTFTDLYYSGAERQGNGALQSEQTHSFSLGARYRTSWATATMRAFYHRGAHMIDWVKYEATDPVYYAADFSLDNVGIQMQTNLNFARLIKLNKTLNLSVAYTYIHQRRHDKRPVYKSGYAGEYLRHKLTATLTHPLVGPFEMTWSMRLCRRIGHYELYTDNTPTGTLHSYHPYAVVDARVQSLPIKMGQTKELRLWMSAENVTNHRYYDFGNMPQPGICVLAGVGVKL